MAEKDFNGALVKLAATISGMVGYIEEQIVVTIEGFAENNPHKCDTAISYTKSVQRLQNESFQHIIGLLVRFKPKGYDAKLVMSSWRIAASLERISMIMRDVAVQIKEIDQSKVAFLNLLYKICVTACLHRPMILLWPIQQIIMKFCRRFVKKNSIFPRYIKVSLRKHFLFYKKIRSY